MEQGTEVVFGEVEAESAGGGFCFAWVECAGLVGVEEGERLADLVQLILAQAALLVGA